MRRPKKGFTLLEVLAAVIILMLIAMHIAGLYMLFYVQLIQAIHKLDAINYAVGLANVLAVEDYPLTARPNYPFEFAEGEYTSYFKPGEGELMTLPDAYFKLKLNGKIKYIVSNPPNLAINVPGAPAQPVRLVKIVVEWTEFLPIKHTVQEVVYVIA